MNERVLDMANGGAFVQQATDPVVSNVATPIDFAAQYPNPLDTTELIARCEEVSAWKAIPEHITGLKTETWREMDTLGLTSGSHYIGFADGACPEEYTHDGDNLYVNLKNIGVKKSLTISDIMHSNASRLAGYGIARLVGGFPGSEGMPGGSNAATFAQEAVADLKEKEVRLGSTIVMNGWDRLLVAGDATTYPLEFDGIEKWAANRTCTFHTNVTTSSGTFSGDEFDRFLSEGCAKPQVIFGHPTAVQEMLSSYFARGTQAIEWTGPGDRIIPGFNFAGFVNTAVGRLGVVSDNNFARTSYASDTKFISTLYPLRMTQDGEDLVYKITQIPLALKDLAPGCTAISFEIWAKTALVIKMCCAQGAYTGFFTGRVVTTCPVIG